jgi:hypothetical protein
MIPRRSGAGCTLALGVLVAGVAEGAAPAVLANGLVSAQFGDRGLIVVTAEGQLATRFTQDEFSVAIDGRVLDSRALGVPARSVAPGQVVYRWTAAPFQLTLTYELRDGWQFVAKQIAIAGAARCVRVDEVVVFQSRAADPIVQDFVPTSARATLRTGDYGACLRFDATRGLLVVAQNPFLEFHREGQAFSLRYRPDMEWNLADGPFLTDRGLVGPCHLTGRVVPARMVPEWAMPAGHAAPGMDEAEIEAFTGMVRAFLSARPDSPVNVFVPWCLNDYQIDIATPGGRAEYTRVLENAAELGANYAIFAPTNSDLARREDSTDDWGWENLLWAGFGQKIRRNEWAPATGSIPPSVQEILAVAAAQRIRLLAYVYPVLAFQQDPTWLTARPNQPNRLYANLGFRRLQDWLIETLVAFHDRLGLGGYCFDHTFLDEEGTSRYAQWWGWRRVMEELRRRLPDIVIDGRQAYHLYGPWSWLAGSYPHPTFNDEQPESFVPFPDLHFDRVSADRERYTAYRYRTYEFAPSEIVPGFIGHQTSRADDTGEMPDQQTDRGVMLRPLRARDWDYLGWRYSLLSSIAVAGWNNVLNMIPGRDPEEDRAFSDADRRWFRRWIDWTAANREFLRHTRAILGQPAIGKIDGTSAIIGDRGYLFLFNPNGRRLEAEFALDASIGFAGRGLYRLRELYPLDARLVGKPGAGYWSPGDRVHVPLDGASALVLEVQPVPAGTAAPAMFNAPGTITAKGGVVSIDGVLGEVGTTVEVLALVPGPSTVTAVTVNGQSRAFTRTAAGLLSVTVPFAGAPFRHDQEVGSVDFCTADRRFTARFTVPARVFEQLARRQQAWPIRWTADDYRTTWLAPERLLLFVQIAEPDPTWEAHLRIDGRTVELRKAYSAVRAAPRTFVGFYADVSLIAADCEHALELDLPALSPGRFLGVFMDNVETEYTDRLRR